MPLPNWILNPLIETIYLRAFSGFDMGYTAFNTYLRDAAGNPVSAGTLGINGSRVSLTESQFVNSAPLVSSSHRYFGGYEHNFANEVTLKANFAYINRALSNTTVGATSTQYAGAGDLVDTPNNGMDADMQVNFPVHFNFFTVRQRSFFCDRRVFSS
jgi:hypothetical protein